MFSVTEEDSRNFNPYLFDKIMFLVIKEDSKNFNLYVVEFGQVDEKIEH